MSRQLTETIRVLHVDDDPDVVDVTTGFLERESNQIETVTATSGAEALEMLAAEQVDCIVSDYQMPGLDGLELLEAVRADYPDLPFILFTGKGNEEIASEAISAGVTDYLQKAPGTDQYTVLAARIENAVHRRRAEDRAETFLRSAPDGIVVVDANGTITETNAQLASMFGYEPCELVGEPIEILVPEGLRETHVANREAYMADPERRPMGANLELEGRRKNGEQVPVDISLSPMRLGDRLEIMAAVRDMTQRKERERRYEAIFNQTYQFTGLLTPDGTLIEANQAAREFAGVDREDVVGKKVWNTYWFQHEDAADRAQRAVERARKGEFVREELEVQGADRIATIDFSVKPIRDENGTINLLVPEGRDITELKQRERELREERAFTKSVFAALPDVFYAFDESGTFLRWNDRFEAVTGYTGEEIADMQPLDFIPADDHDLIATSIDRVFDGEQVTVESHFETKAGEVIPYEFTGAQLRDADGAVLGLVGTGRDITDRKQRQRELEAKNKRLEEFASVVSHDLRNPLRVAEGNLEFARESCEEPYFDRVEAALHRMDAFIDDLLTLAKKGEVVSAPERVDLADLAPVAWRTIDAPDVTLTVDTVTLEADPDRLQELLENLFRNAVEHNDDLTTVRVGPLADGFSVADDGAGIPREEHENVFETGYTRSEHGTGFGLAIVSQIVDAHGWHISVTDSDAGGARFEITGVDSA